MHGSANMGQHSITSSYHRFEILERSTPLIPLFGWGPRHAQFPLSNILLYKGVFMMSLFTDNAAYFGLVIAH